MATVTHVRSTGVTTNSTTYNTTNVAATVNELAIIFAAAATTVVNGVCTDNKGGTYTMVTSASYASTGSTINAWIGNQLVSTSSMTITVGYTGDAGQGQNITIFSVAGLSTSRLGLNALKQFTRANNQTSATAPSFTFSASVSSSNPTLGFLANQTNPPAVTAPSGWTESADFGFNTPANGAESIFRNDTFNGTTGQWSTTTSLWGMIMLELDGSTMAGAAGGFPGRRTLTGVGRV